MQKYNLQENSKSYVGLASKASAHGADEQGTAIDLSAIPMCESGIVLCNTGAATGTPDSFSIVYTLMECATTGGSYTAVTGATVTVTAAGIAEIPFVPSSTLGFLKVRREVTIVNGSSPAVPTSASVLVSAPHRAPLA